MWNLGRKWRVANSEWRIEEAYSPLAIRYSPPSHETNGFPRRCPDNFRRGKGKMAEDALTTSGIGRHGATRPPSVDVDSYNVELKDADGFLGDRASKGAFRKILDSLRQSMKRTGEGPRCDT